MRRVQIGILFVALVVMVFGFQEARAEMKAGSFHISPMIGAYIFEGDQNLDTGWNAALGLGYNFTPHWGAEAFAHYVDTQSQFSRVGDVSGLVYRLDGLYHFILSDKVVPYLAAGLGGIRLDPDRGDTDNDTVLAYGGGLKYFIYENVALRADLRGIYSWDDPDHNLSAMLGVTFQIGGAEKPCADADQDKVCDDVDQCPDTPLGATVDPNGCCLDGDKDGVCDSLDKCPGTPAGAKVDEAGCPVILKEKVSIELRIEFDTNKAVVKPAYHQELKKVADFMKEYVWTSAVIEGHTDSRGSDRYNQKLSFRRANAVRDYLINKFGIAPDRLKAEGFGESRPIATNKTKEGRQRNRRVVAVMSAINEKVQQK